MHDARAARTRNDLPHAPTATRRGGVLYAFTRNPRAHEHVCDLEMRASDVRLLLIMVRYADSDGRMWMQLEELARQTKRSAFRRLDRDPDTATSYAPNTLRVCVRNLRAAGLLAWDYVPPLHRYPSRTPGKPGRFTASGGRVWYVNLAALEALSERERRWIPGTRTPATPEALTAHMERIAREGPPAPYRTPPPSPPAPRSPARARAFGRRVGAPAIAPPARAASSPPAPTSPRGGGGSSAIGPDGSSAIRPPRIAPTKLDPARSPERGSARGGGAGGAGG
jgi:hypothetical protein